MQKAMLMHQQTIEEEATKLAQMKKGLGFAMCDWKLNYVVGLVAL